MKLTTSVLWLVFTYPAAFTLFAAPLPDCINAVKTAAEAYKQQQNKMLNDEKKVVQLLKTLNHDEVLPPDYVTTQQATQMGWSGKDQDSLWGVWALNKKMIGGDRFTGKVPYQAGRWYSADLESVRGIRSSKRLVYSTESASRYLTTGEYKNFTEIAPCQ